MLLKMKKLTVIFLNAVSMGAATGLFLGASLISAVELIMYFCVRTVPRNQQRPINA
jgi:hypothetical protein